jgi:ABC-type phosphate transport system permease subunit
MGVETRVYHCRSEGFFRPLLSLCCRSIAILSLIIKYAMSSTRIIQKIGLPAKRWGKEFNSDFRQAMYVVPFCMGTMELFIYPILISLGSWQAISAWIGLKTAAGWRWVAYPVDSGGSTYSIERWGAHAR